MTANLLIPPQLLFVDGDGRPLVGGTLATYTPGTFVDKATWQDANATILNSAPIVLDARGACVVYGDGDYRLVLKDADGNQIFDLLSSEPLPRSAISDAMLPVVGALTLAQARDLMGVTAAISAAVGAVSLMPGPTGATGPAGPTGATGPTGPQGPSGVSGVVASNSNPSYRYDPTTGVLESWGNATASGGSALVTFGKPYTALQSVVVTTLNNNVNIVAKTNTWTVNSFNVFCEDTGNHGGSSTQFSWFAMGFG